MALPESFLQDLLARTDFESLVGSYVSSLKRRGRHLVGLCPFHGEKTPSFTVYPENNSFYCFGCGAGGDAITFVKKIENLDYIEAVKFLAERAGMAMPERDVDDAASRLRARVLEANREAARLFHRILYSEAGKEGLDYYCARHFTDETIKHFGLGYAPNSFNTVRDALRQKGFHDEELAAAWLIGRKGTNVYDLFRHRVVIPVLDLRGNVVAFGGRVLDDSKPKYLNSGDTPVFKKTQQLFALNFAKQHTDKPLIVCEGYMDVIALHQAGFTQSVAALGTSFTADHARLLARYTKEAILIFDADDAGRKGAQRAMALLRTSGVRVRVVAIPDGKDPDEFIARFGRERFALLLEKSAGDIEYQLLTIGQKYTLTTSDGRVQFLREATDLLAALSSPVERDVYAGKLSKEMNVSKDALLLQIDTARRKRQKQQQKQELTQIVRTEQAAERRVNPDAVKFPRAAAAEQALLGVLLLHPDTLEDTVAALPPTEIVTALHRGIYEALCERQRQGLVCDIGLLSQALDEIQMAVLSKALSDAKERGAEPADAAKYAEVIRSEKRLTALTSPGGVSDEEIQGLLEAMRKEKK